MLALGFLPYNLYQEIGIDSQKYVLGVYLVFTAGGYFVGSLFSGICIRFKLEKGMIIISILLGLLAIVPLVFDIYYTDFFDQILINIFTSVLFSIQIGILETFMVKIIAVNTRKPKFEMLLLKGISAATTAAFFFTGL